MPAYEGMTNYDTGLRVGMKPAPTGTILDHHGRGRFRYFLDDDRNSQYVRLKLHEKTVGRRSSVDPIFFHFDP